MATTTTIGNVVTAVVNNIAKIKTAIGNATTSAAGLMSNTDKSKLDGIATGANKITVDSALSTSSTNPVQNKVVATQINSLNSSLTNIFYSKSTTEKWQNAPGIYFYEDVDASTYSLPYPYCFVLHIGNPVASGRGVAMAIEWPVAGDATVPLWINKCHDTWRGWTAIS